MGREQLLEGKKKSFRIQRKESKLVLVLTKITKINTTQ
jgi:hypothetical protein